MENLTDRIAVLIIGFICGFFATLIIGIKYPQKIFKSEKIITPKIELYINNNKVDTTYVYEIK